MLLERLARRALLGLLGVAAIGAGVLVAKPAADEKVATNTGVDPSFVAVVYRVCGSDEDCIKERLSPSANSAPTQTVEAVLALFDTPDAPSTGCHWALHLVGQILKPRTLRGDTLGLGSLWLSCGSAVLHGAFEDISLEGDVTSVGEKAFALCVDGVLEKDLVGHCFHPIGHTVEMNLPGSLETPYLFDAERACIAGAWRYRDISPGGAALKACVSGAHMRHRDTVFRDARGVRRGVDEDWSDALPQCRMSLLPYACITLYMEDVAGGDPTGVASAQMLAWCRSSQAGVDEVCAYFFGLSLASRTDTTIEPVSIAACSRTLPLDGRIGLACLRGLLDDVGADDGTLEALCRSDALDSASCLDLATYSVEYPPLEDVETLIERRAASGG